MRLLPALLVIAASFATAQTSGRIEGRVVTETGAPVHKATVRLQAVRVAINSGQYNAYIEVSDGSGAFAFQDLPPGTYTISAAKTGYSTPRGTALQPKPNISLEPGEVKKGVEVKLVEMGVVSGQVTDQDGDPVFGAQVQAMRRQYNSSRRRSELQPAASTTTDDQGNFRLLNLQPGRYYVAADDMRGRSYGGGLERLGRSALETNVLTYYPGSPDFEGAEAIEVSAASEVRGIRIRMTQGRVYSIRGKAVDSTGAPVQTGVMLTRVDNNVINTVGGIRSGVARPKTGEFEFNGLLPGTYVIQGQPQGMVRGPDGPAPSMSGRLEVTVGNADVDGVVYMASAPAEITGTIRLEDGDLNRLLPQAPGNNQARQGFRVSLTTFQSQFYSSGGAQAGADGTFKIENLAWDRYLVSVNPLPRGVYIKSARFGSEDVLKNPIDLTSGGGGVLDIVLSPKAAEIDATVRDSSGAGVPDVAVTIWPKTPTLADPAVARLFRTAADGTVKMFSVRPGEYYVAAWEDADQNLLSDPEFLARFTGQATEAELGESEMSSIDVTLIPKDKIAAEAAKLP
jgi:uncharacterized protein (DUF2141 family)